LSRFNPEEAKIMFANHDKPDFDIFTDFQKAGQPSHEEVEKLMQKAPDRIFPFFWYNPIDPADPDQQKGLSKVQYALGHGYRGVKLQMAMTYCPVEKLYPIAQLCEEASIPLYVHPSGGVFRARRTNPFEILTLAEHYPKLKIILGHAGYSMEFVIEAILACIGASNIYFETSLSVPFGIITYIKLAGARRVLFGTDAPSAGPFRIEYDKIAFLNISEKEKTQILSKNIEKLLKIEQ
jgi:predicted TIM-barrel fold metal-dependent hydrolase